MKKLLFAFCFLLFIVKIYGRESLPIDSIFEYNYQKFLVLIKYNQQNKILGREEDNIYTFVFDENISEPYFGVLKAKDSIYNLTAPEQAEIREINDTLVNYNTSNDSIEIYAFVVFGSKSLWLSSLNKFHDNTEILDFLKANVDIGDKAYDYEAIQKEFAKKLTLFYERMAVALSNNLYGKQVYKLERKTRIIVSEEKFIGIHIDSLGAAKWSRKLVSYWTHNNPDFGIKWASTIQQNINNYGINYLKSTFSPIRINVFEIIRTLRSGVINEFIPNAIKIPSFKKTIPLSEEEAFAVYDSLANIFANRINIAYANRLISNEYPYNNFNNISNLDLTAAYNNTELNDQLSYLFEKSGIFFIVMKGDCPIQIPRNLWNSFAAHVLGKIDRGQVDPPNGIVVMTIPTAKYYTLEMEMPGLACTSGTIDLQSLGQYEDRVIYIVDYIRLIFKYCHKKVDIYTGYLYADGTRSFEKKELNMSEGIGHPYNGMVYLLKNIYYDTIANISVPKKELNYGSSGIGYGIGEWYQNPDYEAQMVEYRYKVSDVLTRARNSISNPSSWDTISNIKRLIEPYIDDIINDYIYNYAFTEGGFSKFCQNVGILLGGETQQELLEGKQELQSKHTYDNEALSVFDPIVYATVDIAGLIPGVDNIADVVGLLYASTRGDVDNVISYTAGLAIVGAGAIAAKCAKSLYVSIKGRKFFKNAAGEVEEVLAKSVAEKSVATEALGLESKYMEDIGQDLISGLREKKYHSNQIKHFREITSEADRKTLLSALNKEKGDIYASIRNGKYTKIESVADFVLDYEKRLSLSTILKNMDEATLAKLEKDLAGEGGGVLGEYFRGSPGGVRAWEKYLKGNINDDIRLSPEWLTKLSEDLAHPTWGHEIAQFLDESPSDVKDVWKKLKDNPAYHWELYDSEGFEVGSRWDKWSKREFFKSVTKKGKDFEFDLLNKMKTRLGVEYNKLKQLVPDLDDRYLISQMQFCLPGLSPPCSKRGEYFIADQVWIKFDDEGDILDMVIVDSKLSQGTNFTPGQIAAKNNVGGNLSYKPSSPIERDANDQLLPTSIGQGAEINTQSFFKAFGDGDKAFVNIE